MTFSINRVIQQSIEGHNLVVIRSSVLCKLLLHEFEGDWTDVYMKTFTGSGTALEIYIESF